MARSRTSRTARWNDAAGELRSAFDALTTAAEEFKTALDALREVKDEYEGWLDNLPDGLRDSPVGEKLQAVVDIDLDVEPDLDELETTVQAAEDADLPLGWGKD